MVQNRGKFFLSKNVMRPIKLISGNNNATECHTGGGGGAEITFFFRGQKWSTLATIGQPLSFTVLSPSFTCRRRFYGPSQSENNGLQESAPSFLCWLRPGGPERGLHCSVTQGRI